MWTHIKETSKSVELTLCEGYVGQYQFMAWQSSVDFSTLYFWMQYDIFHLEECTTKLDFVDGILNIFNVSEYTLLTTVENFLWFGCTLQRRQMTSKTSSFACLSNVCATLCTGSHQRKHQSSASLPLWEGNLLVTRTCFHFMECVVRLIHLYVFYGILDTFLCW